MNAINVYEGFIRFEERSAELYLELSVRFADIPELRWFWIEMAMEEKQHAGMLHHCRISNVFADALPDGRQVQRLENIYSELEARIDSPKLTLDDAFDIAIRMESSEINDVYRQLTDPIQGPAYVLRKKMELSVEGHFDKLFAAAKRFEASKEIQTRLARLAQAHSSPHKGL